ncbi:MAG: flagellar biosynthetic protein FliO [Rhizobiaceae bacterium]|nr:flagellar biosynthetic protein FliO [Rhizobiaceae bacterium]
MAWLNSIFGGSTAANLIAITVGLVLVLLGLFWVFRKIAGSTSIRGTKSRRPRLGVTEAAIVDDKRRLVLVRRDNVEHLVLIGGSSDVLVERNIVRVQPATSASEPIKTIITADVHGEDEIPVQSEKADVEDNVPPRGVSALASGAAATAAVVASIETALSRADDVSTDTVPADDTENSEFTAAVADTLLADTPADETKIEEVRTENTGSIADGIIKAETETLEVVETKPEPPKQPTDTLSEAGSKVEFFDEKTPPIVDEVPDIKPEEAPKEEKSNEPDDVAIRIESISESGISESGISESGNVQEETPATSPKEQVEASEVTPPFEVAAAVSHKEPAAPSDAKPKEARPDDMEDEMQKLLSELAGERRG